MKKIISILITATVFCSLAQAQTEPKIKVKGAVDIVSSYIWRGTYNAGASFQPSLSGQIAGFTLGAWGSSDFTGAKHKEVDLSLNYAFKGFSVGVTDYWWEGEGAFKYFSYTKGSTDHRFEANVSYSLPCEKIPLALSINTMFAGNDYKANGDRAYSTYIELNYPFDVGAGVSMNAAVGATPWYSPSILPLDNKGFSVCNVTVGASKSLKLSNHVSIPLFTKLIFNPALEDVYMVFGLSLSFGN